MLCTLLCPQDALFDFELKCSHLSVKGNFSSLPSLEFCIYWHCDILFCVRFKLQHVFIKNFPGSQLVYNKWWWVLKSDQLGTTVLEVLPDPVRARLEDVVGVRLIPQEQFRQHVVHAVERYRQDERKWKEKDNDIQRKLAQLQLGELQGKQKVKGQALLTPGATEQVFPPSTATTSHLIH